MFASHVIFLGIGVTGVFMLHVRDWCMICMTIWFAYIVYIDIQIYIGVFELRFGTPDLFSMEKTLRSAPLASRSICHPDPPWTKIHLARFWPWSTCHPAPIRLPTPTYHTGQLGVQLPKRAQLPSGAQFPPGTLAHRVAGDGTCDWDCAGFCDSEFGSNRGHDQENFTVWSTFVLCMGMHKSTLVEDVF